MLNPTDQPRTIYKDTMAAWCEPFEKVIQPFDTTADDRCGQASVRVATAISTPAASVPSQLDDLLGRNSVCLDPTQSDEAAWLLREFVEVWQLS